MALYWCRIDLGATRLGVVITDAEDQETAADRMPALVPDLPPGTSVIVQALRPGAPVPPSYRDRLLSLDEVERMTHEALGSNTTTMH